ncbi:MAG TPA: AMIN domain-containing protein [Polyangia bacterium]
MGTPMAWPKAGPARVVWTGFQMHGDGSRVYLQATNDVEVSVTAGKEGLTVTVHDCRLRVRNGGRPMDTRFFQTPVKSVSLRQQKKDVAVLIALKEPVDVVPRKESGPNGSQFWVLDFPSGKSLLANGPRPTSANP